MVGAGPGVAAHQDVPLQEDLSDPDPWTGQPAQAWGGHQRADEIVTRAASPQMGQLSAGEGNHETWMSSKIFY